MSNEKEIPNIITNRPPPSLSPRTGRVRPTIGQCNIPPYIRIPNHRQPLAQRALHSSLDASRSVSNMASGTEDNGGFLSVNRAEVIDPATSTVVIPPNTFGGNIRAVPLPLFSSTLSPIACQQSAKYIPMASRRELAIRTNGCVLSPTHNSGDRYAERGLVLPNITPKYIRSTRSGSNRYLAVGLTSTLTRPEDPTAPSFGVQESRCDQDIHHYTAIPTSDRDIARQVSDMRGYRRACTEAAVIDYRASIDRDQCARKNRQQYQHKPSLQTSDMYTTSNRLVSSKRIDHEIRTRQTALLL
eukprot:Tbor_TRINITY_DN4235_c0_g1::TRINITY_DN4235_c0_g1_i1::g.23832::m.23832